MTAGVTVLMHPGQTITVDFPGRALDAPFYSWTPPQSSDQAILQGTGVSGKDASAHGTFTAVAKASAQLTATYDPHCSQPCGPPSMLWSVAVTVS